MLPAALRLGKSPKIAETLKSGRRYASKYFVLHVVRTEDQCATFAFAVSRKVGNSVVRHRITRQLRQIVTQNLEKVPAGSRIVVRALPEVVDAQFTDLNRAFTETISKVH
ncbi:MAG: ribonuclease P protein component [Actinobacteria bacterium]|nr:ribonuclease P protein component [Actinomycetota bacterium]NBY15957.1 ribonuclease P protein component [Actinomycetota bacterium]